MVFGAACTSRDRQGSLQAGAGRSGFCAMSDESLSSNPEHEVNALGDMIDDPFGDEDLDADVRVGRRNAPTSGASNESEMLGARKAAICLKRSTDGSKRCCQPLR